MNLDPDQILGSPFTVGGFGSLVALKFAPGTSWWERLTNVGTGALLAGYVAPALTEWLHFTSKGAANAAAFILGLLGMSLIAAALQAIRDPKTIDALVSWLPRR